MRTRNKALSTKIAPRKIPLLVSRDAQLAVIREWADEDHRKLILLCEELGIESGPRQFYALSLALARKLYAGFQEANPAGKWTDLTRGFLVVEIERLLDKHSVSSAAGVLAKRQAWRDFLGSKVRNGSEALRVQYVQFHENRWAEIMRNAFKMAEYENALDGWQDMLLDALRNPHP